MDCLIYVDLAGTKPGPEVKKLTSCSTQLSTKFTLLINVKMSTIVGILTFISRINTVFESSNFKMFLFDFILYVPSTIFQLYRDGLPVINQY